MSKEFVNEAYTQAVEKARELLNAGATVRIDTDAGLTLLGSRDEPHRFSVTAAFEFSVRNEAVERFFALQPTTDGGGQ